MITIKGTITRIDDVFTKGDFRARSIFVNDGAKYPSDYEIRFKKDKIKAVDLLSVGDQVEVDCYLSGRMWNEKNFLELTAASMGSGENKETAYSNDDLTF